MIVIPLEKTLVEGSTTWQNFVCRVKRAYIKQHPDIEWGFVANDILNKEIKKYNGRIEFVPHYDDDKSKLFFKTEQDYLVWTLKWS